MSHPWGMSKAHQIVRNGVSLTAFFKRPRLCPDADRHTRAIAAEPLAAHPTLSQRPAADEDTDVRRVAITNRNCLVDAVASAAESVPPLARRDRSILKRRQRRARASLHASKEMAMGRRATTGTAATSLKLRTRSRSRLVPQDQDVLVVDVGHIRGRVAVGEHALLVLVQDRP